MRSKGGDCRHRGENGECMQSYFCRSHSLSLHISVPTTTPAPAAMASSSAAPPLYSGGGERGAGGKLRRERKPPSTPYDRPPRSNGGWISRFVTTPAKRLISGGATRLLPSLFSPLPSSESPSRDEGPTEVEEETADHDASCSVDLVVPKSSRVVDPSEAKGKSKVQFSDKDRQDEIGNNSAGQLPDIEQLIKRKTFSKEEFDNLMEILRSRVDDAEQGRQLSSTSGPEEAERAETSHGRQNASMDNEEELDKFELTTTTPLPRATVRDDIGASPVDIARAYMGSRTSELGFTSMGLNPKREIFSLSKDFSSKPFIPSPSPKSPICWPGAITEDQPKNYSTPQSQKSRYGMQSFPRTPYSRTMYTKSKSKLTPFRGDSEKFPNISSTPFQPMRTPVYGKSMTNVAEGSYGTGGPIRRTRNKFTSVTPAKESTLLQTAHRSPWTKESNAGFMLKKNIEPNNSSTPNVVSVKSKPQNSEVGVPSAHPHSSKLARQILEQLDRPITLRQKSEELKLVSSWQKSSQTASGSLIQNNSSLHIASVGASKSMAGDALKLTQTNGETSVCPQDRINAVTGAGKGVSSPSIEKIDPQTKSPDQAVLNNRAKGDGQPWFTADQNRVDITNISSGSEPQNVPRRPVLASISIDKSGQKTSFASDTTAGFTFPVTTSSTTFAEPPTPSMPSSSTSPTQPSKVSANPPIFTFGNKITIAPPVVPFLSTSSAAIPNDASAPKFKFGVGKTRLSFALAGTDADSASNDAAIPQYKFGSGKSRLNFASMESPSAVS